MWPHSAAYHTQRRITASHGRFCLSLTARRCSQESCHRCHHPYRPKEEGRWALPHGEYSLDVTVIPRLPAPVILKEKRHFALCWRMKEKTPRLAAPSYCRGDPCGRPEARRSLWPAVALKPTGRLACGCPEGWSSRVEVIPGG